MGEERVLMRLNPNIKASKLTEQLKNCNNDVDFNGLDPNTLSHFVRYNMSKFKHHKGGNSRPITATTPKILKKVGIRTHKKSEQQRQKSF